VRIVMWENARFGDSLWFS